MKFYKLGFMPSLLLSLSFGLLACNKEEERLVKEDFDLANKGVIKVFNATVGSVRNNIYVDNVPVTGLAGTYGFSTAFPSTVSGFAVAPGSRAIQIKDTLATTTQLPINLATTIAAGKNYTIFTFDTTTKAKGKVVETVIVETDSSRVRFANMIYSATAIPNVDVYSVKRRNNIFTNIAPAEVTDYIPYTSFADDTLYVRASGTTTNLTPVFSFGPAPGRSSTIVFKGRYQTTGTAGVARLLTAFSDL